VLCVVKALGTELAAKPVAVWVVREKSTKGETQRGIPKSRLNYSDPNSSHRCQHFLCRGSFDFAIRAILHRLDQMSLCIRGPSASLV